MAGKAVSKHRASTEFGDFHPELTGRENIFLNGAVLGMTQREIQKKFHEIVAFAEVERFLDTPVKRYSSGMYVRLAFAVAAHLEPEILIVDEVLAVGDAEFQRKCIGKMEEVSRREGRTVLVVSHNMGVVTSLCSKAIWIDQGSIHDLGNPQEVVGRYLVQAAPSQNRSIMLDEISRQAWLADDRLRLLSLEWISSLPLQHGKPASLRLHVETRAPVLGVWLTVGFDGRNGGRVLTYRMVSEARDLTHPGKYWIDLLIDPMILGPDIYELDIGCRSGDFHTLDFVSDCVRLEVVAGPNTPASIAQSGPGVQLEGNWSWSPVQS